MSRYHADHISPPNGGYPFIEWDDLDPDEKNTAVIHVLEQQGFDPKRTPVGLIGASTVVPERSLQEIVTEVRDYVIDYAWKSAEEEEGRRQAIAAMPDAQKHLGRVPSGYLDAEERDLRRAKGLIDHYGTSVLRKAKWRTPLPAGVMTSADGSPINGGSVVYGVTVSDSKKVTDDYGNASYEYEWVMFS